MPTISLESPRTGQTYDVEVDAMPSDGDMEQIVSHFDQQYEQLGGQHPKLLNQTPVETAGVAAFGGLGRVATNAVSGLAKLADVGGARNFQRITGFPLGDAFQNLATQADAITAESRRVYPVNPQNEKSATAGEGAAQAATMLAGGALAKALGAGAQAMATVPGVLGFAQGAGQGIDTAREIGVTSESGQALLGVLFGGIEMATEKLGGIGGKEATAALLDMYRKPAAELLKEAVKAVTTEGIEETISGTAQDILTRAFADEDPNNPGFTKGGVELPTLSPAEAAFWKKRGLEALGGAAGGTVFALAQGATNFTKPIKGANQPAVPVNEPDAPAGHVGDLTAADVADLEAESGGQRAESPRPSARQPILSGMPDRMARVQQESDADLAARIDNYRGFLAANPGYVGVEQDLQAALAEQQRRLGVMMPGDAGAQNAVPALPAGASRAGASAQQESDADLAARIDNYRGFLAANPGYVGVEQDLQAALAEQQRRLGLMMPSDISTQPFAPAATQDQPQTITGSNEQTGSEMPVPPPTAEAGAGAGGVEGMVNDEGGMMNGKQVVVPKVDVAYKAVATEWERQNIMDELAARLGLIKVYSSITGGKVIGNQFDPKHLGKTGSDLSRKGYFFTNSKSVAANYARVNGGKVMEFYINPQNVLEVEGTNEMYRVGQDAEKIFASGKKVILFKNADDVHGVADNYMVGVGNEHLIKSANPTELDDNGNLILPSRRLDFSSKDIRGKLMGAKQAGQAEQAQGKMDGIMASRNFTGEAQRAQMGFTNLDVSGRTAGFLNTEILSEARQQLYDRGMSKEEVDALTPAQAQEMLTPTGTTASTPATAAAAAPAATPGGGVAASSGIEAGAASPSVTAPSLVSTGKPGGALVESVVDFVEASDLEPLLQNEVNADQTRDRASNRASAEQIASIAVAPDPQLLGASPVSSIGAPVVDDVVLAGNGRAAGLLKGYTDNTPGIQRYREAVVQQAASMGRDVSSMKQPVMIRRVQRYVQGDRRSFVVESNPKYAALQETTAEAALLDAEALGDVSGLEFTENGMLTSSSAQQVAIRLKEAQRGVNATTGGRPDLVEATRRVQLASLATLAKQNGTDVSELSAFLETDVGRRVLAEFTRAAPGLAALEADLGLGDVLLPALRVFNQGAQAVATRKFANLGEWAANRESELIRDELPPEAAALIEVMIASARKPTILRDLFDSYLEAANNEQQQRQLSQGTADIFGDARTNQPGRAILSRQMAGQSDAAPANPQAGGEQGAGLKNLDVSGRTAGFLNTEILSEAAALIQRGVTTFAAWSKAMVQKFGEAIRAYLAGVWDNVRRNSELGAVMNPLARGPLRAPESGMASASGAAQANEPSPGGLNEAEGFISERIIYGGGSDKAAILYHGGPKVQSWQTNDERVAQGAFAGFHLTENVEMAKRYAANSTDAKNAVITPYYARIRKLWDTRWQKGKPPTIESLEDWQTFPEIEGDKFRLPLYEDDYMQAAEAGYDGVISDTWLSDVTGDYSGAQIVVFDPEKNIIPVTPESSRAAGGTQGFTNLDTSGRTAGFLNTEILAEATALIQRGVTTFAAWSSAMVRRFGEAIREFLAGIWRQVTSPQTNAARNVNLGRPANAAPVSIGAGGFVSGPGIPAETRARFARPEEGERAYETRADVVTQQAALDWLAGRDMETALDELAKPEIPAGLTGDSRQYAIGQIVQESTSRMLAAKDDFEQARLRVVSNRAARVWQDSRREAARELRYGAIVNAELVPMAPILAAENILIDRGEAVMGKRFADGAKGAAGKVQQMLASVEADITDRVERILATVLGPRLSPRLSISDAVNALFGGKSQRDQLIDEVGKALMQKARATVVSPEQKTALAALAASLKRTLGASIKGKPIKPAEQSTGEVLARAFVDQVAEADTFAQAWESGRKQVFAMLRGMDEAATDAEIQKRVDAIMPATPEAAYAPGMAKEAIKRGFALAGYGAEVATGSDKSGKRAASVKDALRDPQRAINAVMQAWDKEAMAGGIGVEAWKKARQIAFRALTSTITEWQTAAQEAEAKALDAEKNALLAKDSPKLTALLNALRSKIMPGLSWQDVFESLPSQQRERQLALYDRISRHEALKGLTADERLALTNELDKAWQRQRQAVFLRELRKAGALGEKDASDRAKVEKAMPRLLRQINLGVMTSETFREAVAPEYGLRVLTQKEANDLRRQAEEAWNEPPGLLRNRKMGALLESIQTKIGATWAEILNSYWTAAVLSGLRTQTDTFLATSNGFGTNLLQVIGRLARGDWQSAKDVYLAWWQGLAEGALESVRILVKGDYSYTKRFNEDLARALDGETEFRPVPLGEAMLRHGEWWQKAPALVMVMVGRAMTAADHINNTATTRGAVAVARAMHPEIYGRQAGFTTAENEAARAQAKREITGGREPLTTEEKADVNARARELLYAEMRPEDYQAASEIGNMAAYQNDPTGFFGWLYTTLKAGLGRGAAALNELSADQEVNAATRAVAALAGGALYTATGLRFMRFGFNFGADLTRYVPGTYLADKLGFYGRETSAMQRELLLGKNIVGLGLLVALASWLAGKDDEDEGWHIEGPQHALTPTEKQQRLATGIKPLSFWRRKGGEIETIFYKQWPTMGIIGAVGAMEDERRFKPQVFAERGAAGHMLHALQTGLVSIESVSALRNIGELLGGVQDEAGLVKKLERTAANWAGGFVPTVLKDADAWTDPQVYKPAGVFEQMLAQQPIIRREMTGGRPQLNVFGRPVKLDRAPWSRTVASAEDTPEARVLASLMVRGISLPTPGTRRLVTQDGRKVTLESLGEETVWQFQRHAGEGFAEYLREFGDTLRGVPADQAQKLIDRAAERIIQRATFKALNP